MMRYRYNIWDWKLILGVIVVVAVVLALMLNRTALIELSGPKELTMVIKPNESRTFNATIKSQPVASSYTNYSWHYNGGETFHVEEISDNFDGKYSRVPLRSGEMRKLQFEITLTGKNLPEGKYYIDFCLEALVDGKTKRISNTYRLWVELTKA